MRIAPVSIPLFIVVLAAGGCANQVTPGGGPKDTKAPVVESSVPENYSTQFRSKEIRITFDELIQVKDLATQMVVSPPMKKLPATKTKKKTLVLELEDTLKPNTTYTLNFGQAIGDLNEGNPLTNYSYVFSTGSFVDTLTISGIIRQSSEQTPEKDARIMLYADRSDSVPYKSLPLYFAVSDSSGHFKVSNISPGDYKLFALKETNNNYLYDSPDEGIAFLPGTVAAGAADISLELFHEQPTPRLHRAYSEQPGKAVVVVSSAAPGLEFSFAGDTAGLGLYRVQWNEFHDTASVWYANLLRDSLSILVPSGIHTDTATLRLQRKDDKFSKQRKAGLYLATSVPDKGAIAPSGTVVIMASHPVKNWNTNAVHLIEDSVTVKPVLQPDSNDMDLTVHYPWKENANYILRVEASMAKDIYDLSSDSLQTSFHVRNRNEFGTVQVKLSSNGFPGSCLFQLVNDNKETVRETVCSKDTTLYYEYLTPGTYRLRLVRDINGNRKEDTGNYHDLRQPEPVTWYSDKLVVRANWDVEATWKAVFPSFEGK